MGESSRVYADYQATTPVDPAVLEKMLPYWSHNFGNPHSSDHVVGWQAAKAVADAQSSVAGLIGADTDEIIFTSGATEANNLALFGIARRIEDSRRRIVVSTIEHKCVLAAARALEEREGFEVSYVPVDQDGFVDLQRLGDLIADDVAIVSIMAVNNEVGTIQDVESVAEIAHSAGSYFHCDAAQAPCAMTMGGLAEHADLISLSGHKMYGPQGIGALFIRRDLHSSIEPIIYGGGQQEGLRSGTTPLALSVGMGAAADLASATEAATERQRVRDLRDRFVSLVLAINVGAQLNGPRGEGRHPGNANIRFDGYSAQDILGSLQPMLAASTGAACASGIPEPSHVLRAMGLTTEEAESSIRFSFGRYTGLKEIETAADLLRKSMGSLN